VAHEEDAIDMADLIFFYRMFIADDPDGLINVGE
jgi:hypothetical protein